MTTGVGPVSHRYSERPASASSPLSNRTTEGIGFERPAGQHLLERLVAAVAGGHRSSAVLAVTIPASVPKKPSLIRAVRPGRPADDTAGRRPPAIIVRPYPRTNRRVRSAHREGRANDEHQPSAGSRSGRAAGRRRVGGPGPGAG